MNFIGVVVFNINDNIYYTALGFQINDQQKNQISSKIRFIGKKKIVMIIDEINMIEFRIFNTIENQCKKIVDVFSIFLSSFENISIVIFMNDFYYIFSLKDVFYECFRT